MEMLAKFKHPLMLALTLTALGCAQGQAVSNEEAASTAVGSVGCPTGQAAISVGDSFLQLLCGCDEANGTVAVPPADLTCTVPQGTLVVFNYSTATLRHQIHPVGTPEFPPSAVYDPGILLRSTTHAVQLTEIGTYLFEDTYLPALSGRLVVR